MTRPRKPFGANHPGRLPATMLRVLAAEMTEPSRLRKGKAYARDGSVLDIVVDPGTVTVEVQGSRSTPYIATVEVRHGDGMPLKRDINAYCTCPDDANWDDAACKHVVAALFVFADEVLLEPELLDVWRGREPGAAAEPAEPGADTGASGPAPAAEPVHERLERARRHLRLVTDGERRPAAAEPATPPTPVVDPLADVLAAPDGATLPDLPVIDVLEHPRPPRGQLADVLADALRHARFDWE